MEKGEKNKGFYYFLTFMFLGFLLLASTGIYDNRITGSQTADVQTADVYGFGEISNIMTNVIQLPFDAVIKPIFSTLFGKKEYYSYIVKLMLIILLSLILSLGARSVFPNNKRTANAIIIIVSIGAVMATPSDFLTKLFGEEAGGKNTVIGNIIGSLVTLAIILVIFIPLLKWKTETRTSKLIKSLGFLVLIPFISWMNTIIGPTLTIENNSINFIDLVIGIIIAICLIGFFWELLSIAFVPRGTQSTTLTGDVIRGARRGAERLTETGGIRAQPGRVGGFLRGIWGGNRDTRERMAQQGINQIQVHNDEIETNIREASNNISNRSFDIRDVANRLHNLRIILINENAILNRRTINQIINSFDNRRQAVIKNGLTNLINENNRIIRQINPLINDRGVPTGLTGLKKKDRGNTLISALSYYLNNRRTYLGMLR